MADRSSATPGPDDGTVAVVITTFNHAHFLPQALDSILAQTRQPDSVLVVDDGSTDNPESIVARYPQVRLISQQNAGLAAARNAGLHACHSDFVTFLDADDLLECRAIELGLKAFAADPECAFVYGGHRHVSADGEPLWSSRYTPPGDDPFLQLIQGNFIAMHGTVLYRREALLQVGGFNPDLRRLEDYDAYLKLARRFPIAGYPDIIAVYRWHGANMSTDNWAMLNAALKVQATHARAAFDLPGIEEARVRGRGNWIRYYGEEMMEAARNATGGQGDLAGRMATYTRLARMAPRMVWRKAARGLKRRLRKSLPKKFTSWLRRGRFPDSPPPGFVRFGDLERLRPISDDFGFSRGKPIDRHYIETFLEKWAGDVKGRVLEIGDDSYSRRLGCDRIEKQDILHVHAGNPTATIVGDIASPGVLPDRAFDCIIFTQTLHLIYDFRTALEYLHNALKPGGVILLTVPGISQIDRDEWGSSWFWSFTPAAVQRLFSERFEDRHVQLSHFGNVFAATAFLHGIATDEVNVRHLDYTDDAYPLITAVRAVRQV